MIFSLESVGFLGIKELVQNERKWDIYRPQELGMWKDTFALWNRRSAVSFCGQAAERNRRMESRENRGTSAVSFGGFMTADYARRLRPRELNRPGLNGGFERRLETADRNRGN